MGRVLVKQPDGKWAVWSTIVDDFVFLGCDEADLFAIDVSEAAHMSARDTERRLERWHGLRSWEDCLEERRRIHGNEPDFRDDLFDGAVSRTHPGEWTVFFESKLAELCGAYYAHLSMIRNGEAIDPPPGIAAGNLYGHYESILARLKSQLRRVCPETRSSRCFCSAGIADGSRTTTGAGTTLP
jgi:hypothetical protein